MYFVVFQILKIETFCQTAPEKKTKELTFGNVGIEDSGIKKCSTQSSDFGYLPRRNVGIEGSGLIKCLIQVSDLGHYPCREVGIESIGSIKCSVQSSDAFRVP